MSDAAACTETGPFEVVKEGNIQCSGKPHVLQLTQNGLTIFKDADKKIKTLDLPWCEVISVKSSDKSSKGNNAQKGFSLHYMFLKSAKLQTKSMDVFPDESSEAWISVIKEHCVSVKGRPKKVFVIANPIGGAASGRSVYEKKVKPVFELAEIQADVKYTEKAKHAIEIAETQDFSSYDGIVLLGGDGTYHEILLGLTQQTQKSAGVDVNDVNAKLKPLDTPIALIPAGTGNGVSNFLNGVVDATTAALRVVRGEQQRANMFSVYSGGKFHDVSGMVLNCGFFADMFMRDEELRWMGRMRYLYGAVSAIMNKLRQFQCSVEYQQAPERDDSETGAGDKDGNTGVKASTDSPWLRYEGKGPTFSTIFAFVQKGAQKGDKKYMDLSADDFTVCFDHGNSGMAVFKFYFKFILGKNYQPLPPTIGVIERVTAMRFKIMRDPNETDDNVSSDRAKARELENYINCDGEPKRMAMLDFEFRLVKSHALLFGINPAQA